MMLTGSAVIAILERLSSLNQAANAMVAGTGPCSPQ